MATNMEETLSLLRKFTEERNWDQFHNPKDLSIAISVEASELLELFLWNSPTAVREENIKRELADVLIYCFLLSQKFNFDIFEIVSHKIKENAEKYPVELAKGNSKKYTDLKNDSI